MKGLLIKDFRLMKSQINFFIILTAVTVVLAVFSDNPSFVPGYLPFVMSVFALSTISYDEFNNSSLFLFTLPVSRTGYALEKYCLSLILGAGSWLFALAVTTVSGMIKGTAVFSETAAAALIILPFLFISVAVMLPVQLKFGGEKGRIILMIIFGAVFLIFVTVLKTGEAIGNDIQAISNPLSGVNLKALFAGAFIAGAASLLISMKISCSVMNKKEF